MCRFLYGGLGWLAWWLAASMPLVAQGASAAPLDPAGRQDLHDVELDLRARLEQWMAAQGDAGQLTELRAKEHQRGARRER